MGIPKEQAVKFMKHAGKSDADIKAELGGMPRGPIPWAEKGRSGHTRRENYGAVRTYSELIGRHFPSNWERIVGERLWRWQEEGKISDLAFQRNVTLLGCVHMRVDFRYVEDGVLIHHEAKGFGDKRWNMQRNLWALVGPTEYRVSHQRGPDEIIRPRPSDELIEIVKKHLAACG